ncbi:MAG: glycerol-3-phosphate 1-O-acyltransferase PlsY [Erysipelotrichaceae bacterium]|nr:glycerol-3-phosphate 1-O-acyltransferase PlsY [Erysipelotrichaceae bacterium]
MKVVLLLLIGYIIGSIPWGLIIGKVFYGKDIRNYGSGNLGGTNAARVLGKPAGVAVILLDALKAFIVMVIVHFISPGFEQYAGLATCIGHCFPLFAGFKGGKAVACSYGYMLGLALFVNNELVFTFIIPVAVFFALFLTTNYVSLGSICGVSACAILVSIFVDLKVGLMTACLALFVIYRHKANIQRLLDGTESKMYLTKKDK